MNKKIMAIGIISMFILMSTASLSVSGQGAKNKINESNEDNNVYSHTFPLSRSVYEPASIIWGKKARAKIWFESAKFDKIIVNHTQEISNDIKDFSPTIEYYNVTLIGNTGNQELRHNFSTAWSNVGKKGNHVAPLGYAGTGFLKGLALINLSLALFVNKFLPNSYIFKDGNFTITMAYMEILSIDLDNGVFIIQSNGVIISQT